MLRYIVCSLVLFFILHTSAIANPTKTSASEHTKTSMSLAEKNLIQGNSFLQENQNNPEIHSLPSGLQYKIIKEGTGISPGPTDFVTVNYRGMLTDGTEFDSSYTHNAPTTFAVNAVIPGWSEALQLMKPGAKWTIYIPSKLAYGSQGAGRLIGPNATLIFDIELISVKPVLDEDQDGFNDEIEDDG